MKRDPEVQKIYDFVEKHHKYLSSDLGDDAVEEWMKADGILYIERKKVIRQREHDRRSLQESLELRQGCRKAGLILLALLVIPWLILTMIAMAR